MNQNQNQQPLDNLAQECLRHLQQEENSLKRFLEHAIAVQNAVINGADLDETGLHQHQVSLEQEAALLGEAREKIRERIARHFGKSLEAVSIKELSKHLPALLASKLLSSRQRVVELTDAIASANRTNSLLIHQTIDLQQRLQLAMSGQAPTAQTYGASGQLNRAAQQTLLQTDC
jgi:flagellar biosynthesis/type III secretory pathway chaperone